MKKLKLDYLRGKNADPCITEYYEGPTFADQMPEEEAIQCFRSCLHDEEALAAFDWWLSKARIALGVPAKSVMSIIEMAHFIRHMGLIVCSKDGVAEFRVAGTGIEEMVGRSLKETSTRHVIPMSKNLVQVSWEARVREKRVRYYIADLRAVDKEHQTVGVLELPLKLSIEKEDLILSHIKKLPTST